jgi:CTP:molybdopterin cytidylyltransferase MocA
MHRAEPVICEHWREGQAASLRCGLVALEGAEKVLVTLGDEPRITSEAIGLLLSAPGGTRATYDGRPGHPVVLGPEQIAAARRLTGDVGARDVLGDRPTVECGHLCSGRDVDNQRDLEEMRALSGSCARAPQTRPQPLG